MKYIISLSLLLFVFTAKSQTVIEMMYPGDANLVLLQVQDIKDADIVIYKTEDKTESEKWDLEWKFRKWGFANFSIYLAQSENDTLLVDKENGVTYPLQGKVYFTTNPDERGYKNPNFHLEGVFRKVKAKKEGKK